MLRHGRKSSLEEREATGRCERRDVIVFGMSGEYRGIQHRAPQLACDSRADSSKEILKLFIFQTTSDSDMVGKEMAPSFLLIGYSSVYKLEI
jgi:hypothetical protein